MPPSDQMAPALPKGGGRPLSFYIHWPFCQSKCPYCDFNSYVEKQWDTALWQACFDQELSFWRDFLLTKEGPWEVQSIFFGGGTPSLMDPELVGFLIDRVQSLWPSSQEVEVTLEMNPSSYEAKKLEGFYRQGVNRLSLGIQSLRDPVLTFLKRPHSAQEARKALEKALQVFPNLSVDLMYGHYLHSEEENTEKRSLWKEELKEILQFPLPHISLYHLMYEPGTPFFTQKEQGLIKALGEKESIHLMDWTHETLAGRGFERYEISNYSQKGRACRHNMTYWGYGDFLGIGPGAHGRFTDPTSQVTTAFANYKTPHRWIAQVKAQKIGLEEQSPLESKEVLKEILLMGLRLQRGVSLKTVLQKTGKPLNQWIPDHLWLPFQKANWVSFHDQSVRLTDVGMMRLDGILEALFAYIG